MLINESISARRNRPSRRARMLSQCEVGDDHNGPHPAASMITVVGRSGANSYVIDTNYENRQRNKARAIIAEGKA